MPPKITHTPRSRKRGRSRIRAARCRVDADAYDVACPDLVEIERLEGLVPDTGSPKSLGSPLPARTASAA